MEENKKNNLFIYISAFIIIALIIGGLLYFKKNRNLITVNNNDTVTSNYRMSGNSIENFDLFFLKEEVNNKNMVYSPLSIKYTLAMLNEGANGTTKNQITAVIGDYKANKYVNSANLSLANVLYVRDTYKDSIKENYINSINTKYNASVEFDTFKSAKNINAWINKNTLGLIDNIIDDESVNTLKFALINALAIDMDWKYQIQKKTNNEGYEGLIYEVHYNHTTYYDNVSEIGAGGPQSEFNKINFNSLEVPAAKIGATINKYDIINKLGEENIRKTVGKAYDEKKANNEDVDDYDYKQDENGNYTIRVDYTKEEVLDKYIDELSKSYGDVKKSTDFEFYVDSDVKVFAKDLKEYNGTTLQYIGIMPTSTTLNEYIKDTDASKLTTLVNNLKTLEFNSFEDGYVYKIKGYIPFFKYEYELDLMNDLKKMGITDIFDSKASDLSNIADDKNYIEKTAHKANIEFTNEGTKAAAVTFLGGRGAGGIDIYQYDLPVKEIDLTFDKPYMYLIRNKATGELWFVGTVFEPTK